MFRVLILCTGNSARSQMAEALLRQMSQGAIDVVSAGSEPAPAIHPVAKRTLEHTYHIDTAGLHPKPVRDYVGQRFDVVITVCDRAAESCPVFPGAPERIHWSFDDPAAIADPEAQRRAFEHIANELAARLRTWMSQPGIRRHLTRQG